MDVTISSRNVDLPSAIAAAVADKLERLRRFDLHLTRAVVHFDEERNPRIIESQHCSIELAAPGSRFHASAAADDVRLAFDRAVGKLEQQLHKHKTRTQIRVHGS